jgi:large subunit ribosomal protein L9
LAQPIKELGSVDVPIKMPRDVVATVTVRVVKRQEPEEPSA